MSKKENPGPGVNELTVKRAKKMQKELKGHVCGLRANECWLVCVPVDEEFNIPGFQLVEVDKNPNREVVAIVVSSGKGYYPELGKFPKTVSHGNRIPNKCKVGDIIVSYEKAGQRLSVDGQNYFMVEDHRVNMVVE